jgi:hypothetical protein
MIRPEFDDHSVGTLALISMYQTLTFLILQIPVNIPVVIVMLLMESHGWDEKTIEMIIITLLISIESVLIFILAKKGKAHFERYMKIRRNQRSDLHAVEWIKRTPAFSEKQLEFSLGIAACVGIVWCFMIGMQITSVKYLFIVLEGAALLFLSIFVIIRFLLTRKIRPTAIVCIILTSLSLWALAK